MSFVVTGIDKRGDQFLTARIKLQSGRPIVEMLQQNDQNDQIEELPFPTEKKGTITWGVSDSEAIIKPLRVPEAGPADPCELGRFELLQGMLEEEEKFITSVLPTRVMHRVLGIAWRKRNLPIIDSENGSGLKPSFCSRGIALGRGYIEFCHVGQGELIAVVDISPDCASLCLLFRRQAVDLACLPAEPEMFSAPEQVSRFAIDLKTVVNDKLASLQSDGISVPLSALVISGHGVDEQVRQRMTEFFRVGVLAPDIHRGYFLPAVIDSTPFLSDYLVALGLALN